MGNQRQIIINYKYYTVLCRKLHVVKAIDRGMRFFCSWVFKVGLKAKVIRKCLKSCGQNYELKRLKPSVTTGVEQIRCV